MKRARYWVYILASKSRNLYTGVTNNLVLRVGMHKGGTGREFTARYNINRLVYFEEFATAEEAILREKQIKAWRREKRIALIESVNPAWDDLFESLT
jgi:putative endonuclease